MTSDEYVAVRRQLGLILRASLIKRYHNRASLGGDTVGRHSFGVAWLCWFLTNGNPSALLLLAAMQHDIAEACVGDIPAPVLRAGARASVVALEAQVLARFDMPDYEAMLPEDERRLLKMADRLEGLLYSGFEVRGLGNRALSTVHLRYHEYCLKQVELLPEQYRARALCLIELCGAVMDNLNLEDEEDVGI